MVRSEVKPGLSVTINKNRLFRRKFALIYKRRIHGENGSKFFEKNGEY